MKNIRMSTPCLQNTCTTPSPHGNNIPYIPKEIEELHKMACIKGEHTYADPNLNLKVFTSYYLSKRGKCCNSGCRHCPYK